MKTGGDPSSNLGRGVLFIIKNKTNIFISQAFDTNMTIAITLLVVIALVVLIWILIEVKRMRHKIFAIFLIFLIFFFYFSFTASIAGKNIDFSTPSGWTNAGGLYFSWLSNAFVKVKSVTAYAIGIGGGNSSRSSQNGTSTENFENATQNTTKVQTTDNSIQSIWNKLK